MTAIWVKWYTVSHIAGGTSRFGLPKANQMLSTRRVVFFVDILVGSTGFVGSNVGAAHPFDAAYHSTNIAQAFGTRPELCVYAGVRAEKFLANSAPEQDRAVVENAMENIRRIAPKRLVLISTIDVFSTPNGADEDTPVAVDGLHAYGFNRYLLEQWVRENVPEHHILRLPGLFGRGIKKNFIYDLIHFIPAMLSAAKYAELSAQEPLIAAGYAAGADGFFRCTCTTQEQRAALKQAFLRVGFSALNFTDSRGLFQFYNLAYLWQHIEAAVANNLRLLHLAVEPVRISEVYGAARGGEFVNELPKEPPFYDFRTKHAAALGGADGYLFRKEQVLGDIAAFVRACE